MEKFAGEWDLPGGHIKIGEDFEVGMKREVEEETGLSVDSLTFVTQIENLSFYFCKYPEKPIKLSHEHTSFRFFSKKDLDADKKFEKANRKSKKVMNLFEKDT